MVFIMIYASPIRNAIGHFPKSLVMVVCKHFHQLLYNAFFKTL